jgi:hypothetical protein
MHWMYRNRLEEFREQITHFARDFYSARHNEQALSALANRKNIQITDCSECEMDSFLTPHFIAKGSKTFGSSFLTIKFRCGVETFDPELRKRWNKGVPEAVTAEEVARYFQGVCLLCCTEGETRERIVRDIELARKHFEYFSVNVFCNNTTKIKRDQALVDWFVSEVYPTIKDDPRIEVLIDNTDLGVG